MNLRVSECLSALCLDLLDGLLVQLFIDIPADDGSTQRRVLERQFLSHSMTGTGDQDDIARDISFFSSKLCDDGLEGGVPELDLQNNNFHYQGQGVQDRRNQVIRSVEIQVIR